MEANLGRRPAPLSMFPAANGIALKTRRSFQVSAAKTTWPGIP